MNRESKLNNNIKITSIVDWLVDQEYSLIVLCVIIAPMCVGLIWISLLYKCILIK